MRFLQKNNKIKSLSCIISRLNLNRFTMSISKIFLKRIRSEDFLKKLGVLLVLIFVIYLLPSMWKKNKAPQDQASFVSIVKNAKDKREKSQNDMQNKLLIDAREKEICESLKSLNVENWIGEVKSIGTNSDGRGVLKVEISKDISLMTWSNSFSDYEKKTMLSPGTDVFKEALQLRKGQKIKFSGNFFKGKTGHCIYETSLTQLGGITNPDYLFKFSKISAN